MGLWLPDGTARELQDRTAAAKFKDWLCEHQLVAYTLNGFPFGDFHQAVVKHAVYQPNWLMPQRLEYTLNLAEILARLLPSGQNGSISTLPVAWKVPDLDEAQWQYAAEALTKVARRLDDIHQRSGTRIRLCLEPEPGCALQESPDVVRFFEQYVDRTQDSKLARQYLGVCHDVCHANVMFELQADVIRRYQQSGIPIGKVQVSSSLCANLTTESSPVPCGDRLSALEGFAEDRYLHQTSVRLENGETRFFEDLPLALSASHEDRRMMSAEWRVHFHVPIHLERLEELETGQADICACLRHLIPSDDVQFEVETYAWNVLPPALRTNDLADGIAKEMRWLQEAIGDCQELRSGDY